jgi:hypothetical protein
MIGRTERTRGNQGDGKSSEKRVWSGSPAGRLCGSAVLHRPARAGRFLPRFADASAAISGRLCENCDKIEPLGTENAKRIAI